MNRFICALTIFAVAWIEFSGAVNVRLAKHETIQLTRLIRPTFKIKAKTKVKGRLRGPRAAGTKYNNSMKANLKNLTQIGTCNEPFPAPDKAVVQCPAACPLMRFDEELLCHWKCISEDQCRSYRSSVVDLKSGMCSVCAVPGCSKCSSSFDSCTTCHEGYDLRGGLCLSPSRYIWRILAAIVLSVVVLLLLYVTCIAWRPVRSEAALDWAIEQRSRTKPREDGGAHKLLPLGMSLSDNYTTAGGIGTVLHFSWQRMVLIWCAFVVLIMGFVNFYHNRLHLSDIFNMAPGHDEMHGVCKRVMAGDAINEEATMQSHYVWATGIVYVASFIGTIVFAIRQRLKYARFDAAAPNMHDYAVLCSGFPLATEAEGLEGQTYLRLEDEYTEYFASAWGDRVLGVSIVWDTDERLGDVQREIYSTMENLHQQMTPRPAAESRPPVKKSRLECLLDPTLEWLDNAWWGKPVCSEPEEEEEVQTPKSEQVETLLSGIKTTGFAFAVIRTEQDMMATLEIPLPKFRDQFTIKAEPTAGEAEVVLWDAFTTTAEQRMKNIIWGCLQLIAVIFGWTCCFWLPYTYYILSWQETAGASQGTFLGGLFLGLLITVGNQIVYAVCQVVSDNAKFTSRDNRDIFYTALYTVAVLVNTVLDMWLVAQMAIGFQRDTAADPRSLVRNPTMQHALYTQLVFYLWPCTLLLPFLLEPLVTSVAPYFLGKWLVRSRSGITPREAEDCLALPPFDLNRYGDIIVNVTLVMLFFFLTSMNLWWIVLMLAISNSFIFAWDNYRFKRCSLRTHFATPNIEILSNFMCVLPCATLAGALMFKYSGGQSLVSSWAPDNFLRGHPEIWAAVIFAFISHSVVHSLILAFVVPRFIPDSEAYGTVDTVPYAETASKIACNWFNANPVHCLRSQYLFKHSPHHVHYMIGREHLHRKNTNAKDANAFIIYEQAEFEKEQSLREELSQEVDKFRHTMSETAQQASSVVRRASSILTSPSHGQGAVHP